MSRPNPFYLRGEAYYANDHRTPQLPERVREALQNLIDSADNGDVVIQTAHHTISESRAFAYARGNKKPSDTLYGELVQQFG